VGVREPGAAAAPGHPVLETVRGAAPAHRYRRLSIDTALRWEHWQDIYDEVLDPLVKAGADLVLRLRIVAESGEGVDANMVDLQIRESLQQRGLDAEVEAE